MNPFGETRRDVGTGRTRAWLHGCTSLQLSFGMISMLPATQVLAADVSREAEVLMEARHGLTLVSVPRGEVVTGGDVLLGANRADLQFSIANGAHVAAKRFANPDGGSWYLVSGLPEAFVTLIATDAAGEFDRLQLHNASSDGPVMSGPRETPFFCQTEEFVIAPGLGKLPATQPPICGTSARVDTLVRRANGEFEGVAPEAAIAELANGSTLVHLETGVIDRAIYQIAMPADSVAQVISPGVAPTAWNGKLIYKFGGGCRGGWYRQGSNTAGVLDNDLLSLGYAVVSASLNVFGNNCNDLLASEVMMMVREHFIEAYGPPKFTLGFGCSGGAYQSLQIADNYPGLLDGILIGCTFPEVGVATLTNLFDARLLEHYFAEVGASQAVSAPRDEANVSTAIATTPSQRSNDQAPAGTGLASTELAGTELAGTEETGTEEVRWSDAQMLAVTGYASINNLHQSAEGAARIDVTPRADRKSAEFDNVVPPSTRYRADKQRNGARPTLFDHAVNVYGQDAATGYARWALDNRGVQYGLQALNKGQIALAQFIDLNRRVGGLDREGNVVVARTTHDPEATRIAYSSGRILSARGGLSAIPIVDYRAWADRIPKGDIHMAYHSQSLRARLQRANHGLDNTVLLVEDGSCDGCELFSLQKSDVLRSALKGIDRWLTERTRPAELSDACWIDGNKIALPNMDQGMCANRFPNYGFPRLVAGAPIANDIVACELRPLSIIQYPNASLAEFAALNEIFPDGVCDWSKPGIAQASYAGVWQSFGPVAFDGVVMAPAVSGASQNEPPNAQAEPPEKSQ